jgi:hypothetical protein
LRIYLDVSCLNRPFDDQAQARIRLEAEAVASVLAKVDAGGWTEISSEMARLEVNAIKDEARRSEVQALLHRAMEFVKLSPDVRVRSVGLEALGFKPRMPSM